jgi:AmmeMemoRadiSam system protein B
MLPRIRANLDFMPSPVEDRPGLLIRDPFQYSGATLIIPPALVGALEFLDGEHSELDLRAYLVRLSGDLQVSELQNHLLDALSSAGFLDDEKFAERKQAAERAFAAAEVREPAHAGSGYPENPEELAKTLDVYLDGKAPANGARALAIAAPHVSPFGGIEAYRAAYRALTPADAERTFVILGTSHYGAPDHFGLTRKPFVSPLGQTMTDIGFIDQFSAAAGDAAVMEDYCHAVEHSIEFQVVFLQHLFGPQVRVVPILCGVYARSLYEGGMPDDSESVGRALNALGEIAAREGDRLCWVLGVDMAHMGRRYGDRFEAHADRGEMENVAQLDQARIQRMEAGDARGFWELIQENQDPLKWCGSAPIYTFLKAVPQARGNLLRYQQWNIDEHSVVSFAGMKFA